MTEKIPARVPGGAVAEGELTALLGTMPYAVSLGVELEAASAAETRGHQPLERHDQRGAHRVLPLDVQPHRHRL
ncbi:hypothetical protein ACFRPV_39925, partial [Kitasatospora sp. NPDC056808]